MDDTLPDRLTKFPWTALISSSASTDRAAKDAAGSAHHMWRHTDLFQDSNLSDIGFKTWDCQMFSALREVYDELGQLALPSSSIARTIAASAPGQFGDRQGMPDRAKQENHARL